MVERCRFCVRETYGLSRLISASWILIMMLSMLRSLKYWFDEIIGEKLFEHLSYSFIGRCCLFMYMILENVQNILKKFDKTSDDFENNEYNL